jgi:hypothetical protein
LGHVLEAEADGGERFAEVSEGCGDLFGEVVGGHLPFCVGGVLAGDEDEVAGCDGDVAVAEADGVVEGVGVENRVGHGRSFRNILDLRCRR